MLKEFECHIRFFFSLFSFKWERKLSWQILCMIESTLFCVCSECGLNKKSLPFLWIWFCDLCSMYILGVELDQVKQTEKKDLWFQFQIWMENIFVKIQVKFELKSFWFSLSCSFEDVCISHSPFRLIFFSSVSMKNHNSLLWNMCVHKNVKILWCVDDMINIQEKNENCRPKTVYSTL